MFWLIIIIIIIFIYQIEPFQIKRNNKLCDIVAGPSNSLLVACDNNNKQEFTVTSSEYKKVMPNLRIYNYPNLYKSQHNKQYVIKNKDGCKLTFTPEGSLLDKDKYHAVMKCDKTDNISDYQQMILSKCGKYYRIHPKNRKSCYLKADGDKLIFQCFSSPASAIRIGDSFNFKKM